MNQDYTVSQKLFFQRRLLRAAFRQLLRSMFRIRIEGQQNIPLGSSYILAANHVSIFEPPLLLSFWPEMPEVVAAREVWERPGQGLIAKGYGAIPVRRGEYDRNVIETMLAVLRAGRPVMIAPEGTRSHEIGMQRAQPGVAYIVEKAKIPVLPVAVKGTHSDLLKKTFEGKRSPIEIRIGKPFWLPAITEKGKARRAARQRNADAVMLNIAALLPEEYHGVYSGQVASI